MSTNAHTNDSRVAVLVDCENTQPDILDYALRNASDQFFEWTAPPKPEEPCASTSKTAPEKPEPHKALPIKRRPKFVIDAITLLANNAADGEVHLSMLGAYLKRMDPGFSPSQYGHSGLLHMLQTYDLLTLKKKDGGHYTVMVAQMGGE